MYEEDSFKSDIFIIGCIILNLMTKKVDQIFNFQTFQIDAHLLQQQLAQVKPQISQHFYDILDWILQFDEKHRPNPLEIANQLEVLGEVNDDPSFDNFIENRKKQTSSVSSQVIIQQLYQQPV